MFYEGLYYTLILACKLCSFVVTNVARIYTRLYVSIAASVICSPSFISSYLPAMKLYEYSRSAKVPDKIEILAILLAPELSPRKSPRRGSRVVNYLRCKIKRGFSLSIKSPRCSS